MNCCIANTFQKYLLPMICISSSIILLGKGPCIYGYPVITAAAPAQLELADLPNTTMLVLRAYFDQPFLNLFG
jgi:uncharacterized membrane protein YczE